MKFTWGHAITITFILFAVYILSFVYRSFQTDVQLVAEDYYAQEVAYQGRIDDISNASVFTSQMELSVTEEGVMITLPSNVIMDKASGKVHLFRPSDEAMDRTLPLTLSERGSMLIPASMLSSGLYEVNLSWRSEGKGFYITKKIVI